MECQADPGFLGDPDKWNPEQVFLASVSQCHMLWYLGLCARAGIVVREYVDEPVGTVVTAPDGSGRFTEVVLRPRIVVDAGADLDRAAALHARADEMCIVSQSVSCDVRHEPSVTTA